MAGKYTEYKNKFQSEKYDRISVLVEKGRKESIKAHAESKGMSLNAFIVGLIDKEISKNNNI